MGCQVAAMETAALIREWVKVRRGKGLRGEVSVCVSSV